MTNQELERRLADALSRTALNDLEGVLSRCKAQKGNVIQMTTKKKNPLIKNLIAACLILAFVGGCGGGGPTEMMCFLQTEKPPPFLGAAVLVLAFCRKL